MLDEYADIISETASLHCEGVSYSQLACNIFQKIGPQSPPAMAYIFKMALGSERFETHDFLPTFAAWWPDKSEISDQEFNRKIHILFEEFPLL